MSNKYDVIVVGGGHAGIEASIAPAKMGLKTLLITMSHKTIGRMSCNPAIGGQAKGHLVREIDAMGGMMGLIIDQAGIHFKMLNKSKGPAVWSPRAQADRELYESVAQSYISNQKNLTVIDGIAGSVITDSGKITGVKVNNDVYFCSALILTCGTFLNGKIHIGLNNYASGRSGEDPALGLTESLTALGFKSGRLKTGTPPRVDSDSVDWTKTEIQEADNPPEPFSFRTDKITNRQIDMYITYTNEKTHEWLRTGLDESPMYTGRIQGVGPRYCPSIEDKIMRFKERERHQIFLEPEGYNIRDVYVNGFSTSLPERAQTAALKTIPGLENCKIIRLGYAIEYDYFEPYQLSNTMETKLIDGLYFAGQICGTSGYEEAAAQGFIAGTNAALKIKGEDALVLTRSESYVGVLIDDLINKSTLEPYRMFTSSAEFRLLLRQDNADIRLIKHGIRLGLIDSESANKTEKKINDIKLLTEQVKTLKIRKEEYEAIKLDAMPDLNHSETVATLLKRTEVNLDLFNSLEKCADLKLFDKNIRSHVEFEIKYAGYISRQFDEIKNFEQSEERKIPDYFDYHKVSSLSNEAVEKLNRIKPASFGQASRISGLRPSDLNVLLVHLEKVKM